MRASSLITNDICLMRDQRQIMLCTETNHSQLDSHHDAGVQNATAMVHPFPGTGSEPKRDAIWKRCGQTTNWSKLAIASIRLDGGAFCIVCPSLVWHTGNRLNLDGSETT